MPKYTTSQGDSIPSLAADNGHFWETLWNHGENAALKALRKNPNILAPGDEVFIPEIRIKNVDKPSDATHKFVRKGIPAKLKIQLFVLGEPRANEPYTLLLDDQKFDGTTDGDGNIEAFIPPNCRGGQLMLNGGKEVYPVNVGHLNPIELVSGVKQRLNNLGYYCGGDSEDVDEKTQIALSQFQGEHDLPQSGEIDDATRSKLQSLHP